MTLPPVIRVFFAVDLPASTKEQVGGLISALKRTAKSHAIRWAKPENLHITLQFLPEIQSGDLEKLAGNARTQLGGVMDNKILSFGGLNLFPSPFRPRVIVLDVTPQEDLASLAALIGKAITAANYPIEERPFRAHLTLGRIKHAQGVHLNFLSEFQLPAIEKIELGEVVLFRSEPHPDGSRYTPLDKILIGQRVLAS